MQKTIVISFTLVLCALVGIAATIPTSSLVTRDLRVNNTTDTVGLTIQKGTVTSNLIEAFSGSSLKFAVPADGKIDIEHGGTGSSTAANAKTALGIQAGSATTAGDGTVTNTFSTAFSSAPKVVTTLIGYDGPTNNVVSVSTTNFIYSAGSNGKLIHWIAVGAP